MEIHVPVGGGFVVYCTVYDVMGLPPSDAGGFHVKVTLPTPDPDFALKPVGVPGTLYVVAVANALYGPVPAALTAAT
jgi:hypothetical protein